MAHGRKHPVCHPHEEGSRVKVTMDAVQCNAHHATLGDSNSKELALSIDTGICGLPTESMKSGKG